MRFMLSPRRTRLREDPCMTEFVYGRVDGLCESVKKYAVMTMDIPWSLVKDRIGGTPTSITMVRGLEHKYLDELVRELPIVDMVVGIGGGVAVDAAKYFAWKRQCSLALVPTIVSVDAYVSPEVAVRDSGVVHYIGKVSPEKIVIDYRAIQSAPRHLNTSGAGDIYSSRTALFDWKLAHEKTGESYDENIAAAARRVLDTLVANASEIKNVTEKGIRTLVELHSEESRLQIQAGKSRPEEGSEHAFFYTLENLTNRSFIHGQVVGTGIYISSHLQTHDEDEAAQVMDSMGLLFRPKDYGISREEFINTILGMRDYSRKGKLPFSILDAADISPQRAARLWDKLSS